MTTREPGTGARRGAPATPDPVVARRRRIARWAEVAQRGGYLLFGLAVVVFLAGMATAFPQTLANVVVVALVVGSVLLAPAIVVGYAVRAADREDRARGLGEDGGRVTVE